MTEVELHAEIQAQLDEEDRYILIGQTKRKRLLFVIFALRSKKVRIISARDLNKKERSLYGQS